MSYKEWLEDIRGENDDQRKRAKGHLYAELEKALRKHYQKPLSRLNDAWLELIFNDFLYLVLDYALEINDDIQAIDGYVLPKGRPRISAFIYPEDACSEHIKNCLLKWINEVWHFRYAVLAIWKAAEKRPDPFDQPSQGDGVRCGETQESLRYRPKIDKDTSRECSPSTYIELLKKIEECQSLKEVQMEVPETASSVLSEIISRPQIRQCLLQFCHKKHSQLNAYSTTQFLLASDLWHSGEYKPLTADAVRNIHVTMLSRTVRPAVTLCIAETWVKNYLTFMKGFLINLDEKGELEND